MSGPQAAPAAPANTTATNETPTSTAAAPAPVASAALAVESQAAAPLEAAAAERARISAITGSEEAKGRAQLASHIAFNTALSADDAKALLAASPKEAGSSPLAAAMHAIANPAVGSAAPPDKSAAGTKALRTADIYQMRSQVKNKQT